ncbi:MAG: Sir2 family NAD-dependent protein deacetylase [bacterium]|nr:Sir2 family NAD-dependent protein deacetylase [bacterium]
MGPGGAWPDTADSAIATLREWLAEARSAVFFGGAGVSTGSGIPDFRGEDGQYRAQWEYPLEEILGIELFEEDPSIYYRYFRATNMSGAQPNVVHRRLAELEASGNLAAVVTQNIDGLHQRAGSRVVHELHGSLYEFYCAGCGEPHNANAVTAAVMAGGGGRSASGSPVVGTDDGGVGSVREVGAAVVPPDGEGVISVREVSAAVVDGLGVPRCGCGGVVRPTVVFYGEGLDGAVVDAAVAAIRAADVLVIGGTSMVVYPAAGLPNYYRGRRLVMINREPTPFDDRADLVIREDLGVVFSQV